jgi:peroxiredoxin
MAVTPSTMPPLGMAAPDFALPDTEGAIVRRDDFAGRPLLVMFICNHCPFVVHLKSALAEFGREFGDRVAIVGINANDPVSHPADAPGTMGVERARAGWTFPYLFDETQAVASAYAAACTPDFFLFDAKHRLAYRGRFDESTPGNRKPITGADLRAAVEAVIEGQPPVEPQVASMGCNIKWRKGNGPRTF